MPHPRAPKRRPFVEDAALAVFVEQPLHVGDEEAEHGPLDPRPFRRVVPLHVQFDAVPAQTGIGRIAGGIGEREPKAEPSHVEADRGGDIPRRQHGLHGLDAGHAGRPAFRRYR